LMNVTNNTLFFDFWNQNLLYLGELGERHSMLCLFVLGIILETLGLIPHYSWVKQGMTIIHKLNKLLIIL
jgi:hypothetical protein